jgi:hypothetical protein
MTATYHYAAYGLAIASNRPLPGLAPLRPQPQSIVIDFAGDMPRVEGAPFFANGFESCWHRPTGEWVIRYGDARDGSAWALTIDEERIVVGWTREGFLDDVAPVLQGPGLAAALHQRGVPVLHGAVIATDSGAILLIGAPGAGKSTTAASLVRHGFALMSDDVAPLRMSPDGILAESGYPRLRLFAASARAAGWSADLPRLFADDILGDKRFVDLDAEFCAEALPLAGIYFLRGRDASLASPRVEPLASRAATAMLMQNIYCSRFLDGARKAGMLRVAARVGAEVPVRAVTSPDDLSALPQVVDAIACDVRGVRR